jgi:FG-GAP repeat
VAALAAALAIPAQSPAAPLDRAVAHDIAFARAQLNRTLSEVPTGAYPHQTNADGTWGTHSAGWWTSGFFPGAMWHMFALTGDPAWRSAAAARQAGIEGLKNNTSTHDLGFMIFDSFGNGFKLTGTDSYRQTVLTAASSLATRYSSTVHAIRSQNNASGDSPTDFRVIIDTMMNLELLWWASKHGGLLSHGTKALEHARTTANQHVRADGSTNQLVVFDSDTGAVKRKGTIQGAGSLSTWARGQAWAVHGFTMAYRESRDSQMLATARKVADYYVSHLPADKIPYWDFQAPGIPNEPRDSSAAAIAASGLIELSQLDSDITRSRTYLDTARATLESLSSPAYLAEGTSARSILLHGTDNKPLGQYDRGLIYGDYFFLEALRRYRAAVRGPAPAPDFNGDGYDDLAVGAPGEDASGVDVGAVDVLYGGAGGPGGGGAAHFGQGSAGGSPRAGDAFGAAVGTGDFNGDGYSDLAVGAPGESGGAGAVNVVYGSASGLVSAGAQQLGQGSSSYATEAGDHFGVALAAGDFNGDGYADLAGGAPDEDTTAGADVGSVSILPGSATGLAGNTVKQLDQQTAGGTVAPGDHFGAALTAGQLDTDRYGDLAVGAPDQDAPGAVDAGCINVLLGGAWGLTSSQAFELSQSGAIGGQEETGDRYGAALTAGDFDGDGDADLAAGAPGEDGPQGNDVGSVVVVPSIITNTGARQYDQGAAGGTPEPGDRFGAALAAGSFDGDGHFDLVVGAPDEDAGASDAGHANVLFGSPTTLGNPMQLDQSAGGGAVEAGDRFGAALTVGNFNGDNRDDVAVGAPREDDAAGVDAGKVNVIFGQLGSAGSVQLDQSQTGDANEGGDKFGAALR